MENIYVINRLNGKPLIIISMVFLLFVGVLIIGANKNSPYYLMPEYQSLVQKAVMNNYERTEEKIAADEKKDYVILADDMYEDELGIKYKGGNDEDMLRKKQARMQGSAIWNSPWEDTIYYYNVYKGYVEPHVLNSGQITVYSKYNNMPWMLNKGDTLSFEIMVNNSYYESNGMMAIGYIKDEKIPGMSENRPNGIIKELKIENCEKIEFTASEEGSYIFYILCGDSAPILVNWIKIS